MTTYPQLHINTERAGDVPWLIPQGEDTGSDFALNSQLPLAGRTGHAQSKWWCINTERRKDENRSSPLTGEDLRYLM